MLRLLTAFLTLSLCALAQRSTLNLYPRQAESQPAEVLNALRAELHRVLQPLDTDLAWRGASGSTGQDGRLVIVKFSGACSYDGFNPIRTTASGQLLSLASTAVSNGQVLPFVTIECARLRDRIAPQVIGLRTSERNEALGRAAARVLAHEIYHVLTGNRKHAAEGIAAECLSGKQLLADRFDLDDRSLALMRPTASPEPVAFNDDFDPDSTGR